MLPFCNLLRSVAESPAFQSVFFVKLHRVPFFKTDRFRRTVLMFDIDAIGGKRAAFHILAQRI